MLRLRIAANNRRREYNLIGGYTVSTIPPRVQDDNIARIYGLVDPLTYDVFYVGRTSRPLHLRLAQHLNEARHNRSRKKSFRICSILQNGLSPLIVELEQVALEASADAEGKWMDYYRSIGITLTNISNHHCGSFPYTSNLPSSPKKRRIPRDVILQLGCMPDKKLGEIYDIPQWVITRARNRRAIVSFDEQQNYPSRIQPGDYPASANIRKIHFSQETIDQLGKESDGKIAKRCGVSSNVIRNERTLRGISPFKATGDYQSRKLPKEAIDLLGSVYDRELAARYNVSNTTIADARKKRGIPSFDEQHGFSSRIQAGHRNELRWMKGGDA